MEVYLPIPVTLPPPPAQRAALEIVNNTQAVNTVKDQSEKVDISLPPEGCYGYRPELIIEVFINEHGKSFFFLDKPKHVDVYFKDSPDEASGGQTEPLLAQAPKRTLLTEHN